METLKNYLQQNGIIEDNANQFSFNDKKHYLLEKDKLNQDFFLPRQRLTHKGDYGHALLIAGSENKAGACILSAKAALRSGVGLLTVHIPRVLYNILQTSVFEAMTQLDKDELVFTSHIDTKSYQAIGIGPGLDTKDRTKIALMDLLEENTLPMVLDADALNLLSTEKNFHKAIKSKQVVLTPHVKEFERLFGKFSSFKDKVNFMREFSSQTGIVIVLKDALTTISTAKGEVYFNVIGNAGMATGGSGDVLTGIILSLLAQGYSTEDSAKIGVYLHALSGDLAKQIYGEASLISSDIINSIPMAIKKLSE